MRFKRFESVKLEASKLDLAYGNNRVIDGLDLALPVGKITAIIGANGSGKSTLLRGMARILKPENGLVLLDGSDINQLSTKAVAQQLGFLPQGPVAPSGLTVHDLARRGRYPHQDLISQWTTSDQVAVDNALRLTGLEQSSETPVDQLSGGQRQRAWLAMALSQETQIMLLDEPTTYLDIAHQVEILNLLKRLNSEEGRTIVMVLHDLNQACRYADHMVAMMNGQIVAAGTPDEVVTPQLVEKVFGLMSVIIDDPVSGTPMCVPSFLLDGETDEG
ncbi:MAG: cobalamin/Fe(3+)-siderophore ABC transporter ATP-binding protein [Acidimicrobiaceae bacterium]|nr:cobalamin/Fe(3+)-siderophore ABC transporter ATP-binding protein [Acidimicrobiaceae bacterium]